MALSMCVEGYPRIAQGPLIFGFAEADADMIAQDKIDQFQWPEVCGYRVARGRFYTHQFLVFADVNL